ncbi:hypothetical protein EXIGLDRAFT_751122 [Exidia glandulosa HHB12029]|uniref:Uncharacterized protein n=1 Tax=Exidia glandulosa HHB12029 TaxID=1314781 RepID=A0A165FT99_EXIGL|nr:hypothetical protein EXIGLDRAFT_751122 [Exidia glandulosa HHB12029]
MASSYPRSFTRSGTQAHTTCLLLDAALERCGGAPSSSDLDASAHTNACCDFEIKHLTQACWACTSTQSNDASCASASRDADVALGMSICSSRSSISLSSRQYENAQPAPVTMVHTGLSYDNNTLFLVTFFGVATILALGVFSFLVHRWRRAQPYAKGEKRRAFLDLTEGFTPIEERARSGTPEPRNPWVQFQPDLPTVEPPPRARTPTPGQQMFEIPRRTSLLLTPTPSRDAFLLTSPPAALMGPQRRTTH